MTATPGTEPMMHKLALALARSVRERRLRLEWTIDRLAARSGVSKGAIVALEHGETNPTFSTLVRLADALGVSVSDLLGDDASEAVQIVEHETRPPLWRGPHGGHATLILTVPGAAPVEVWEWVLMPGERYVSHPHPRSVVETLTVISGLVELTVGDRTVVVPAGSTATFAADRDHTYAAKEEQNKGCAFLMTVHLRASHGAPAIPP